MSFTKFTSIESFAHTYRGQQRFDQPATVAYGSKIKLHGTNAAVRIEEGKVAYQSRSRDLSLEDDNAGFMAWASQLEKDWMAAGAVWDDVVIFHGEWAGQGIQKNDAVTKIDGKYFFIFALQIGEQMITEPSIIIAETPENGGVIVLPWFAEYIKDVDFTKGDSCQEFIDTVNAQVEMIGERDPYIFDTFGVDGVGEGLVCVPRAITHVDEYSAWTFKTKSTAHAVTKNAAASKSFVIPAGVEEFVEQFVTPARCEQALSETSDGPAEKKNIGPFLKWMGQDILKESAVELEESGLEWKAVQKYVTDKSKKWYLGECNVIQDF